MTTRALQFISSLTLNANDICVHNELALYTTHYSAFPRFLMLGTFFFHHYYIRLNRMGAEQAQVLTGNNQNKRWLWTWLGSGLEGPAWPFPIPRTINRQNTIIITRAKTTSFNLICHPSIWGMVVLEVLRQQPWFFG